MEARSFPYDRGKTGWAAAAAAVRFATRQEEAETAVLRTLGVPGLDAPVITPTRHGIPADAGAGGHEMFVVDGREAGLGPSDQDCGESLAARQTTAAERQSAAARQATEWGVDGSTAGHGERKFYGEGAWRLPPGRSHEQPESQLRHAAFRRWVRGPAPHPRRCACCDEEEEEEREATALHILGAPGLSALDITPTCHGTPSAGAGGHEIFMGDDREAGLGLGGQDRDCSAEARRATEWGRRDQEDEEERDCEESAAARQTTAAERQSAAARQATEWGVDGSTAGHGERKFYGEGAWRLPPGRSHEQPESQLRHAAFRRWVRGPAPHPRRCACCDEEEEEEREATALHILGAPGPSAPDITPTCHGMPSAGAGGHEIFMGDDREAGLGLGDQGCGASAAVRQAPEKERNHASGAPRPGCE